MTKKQQQKYAMFSPRRGGIAFLPTDRLGRVGKWLDWVYQCSGDGFINWIYRWQWNGTSRKDIWAFRILCSPLWFWRMMPYHLKRLIGGLSVTAGLIIIFFVPGAIDNYVSRTIFLTFLVFGVCAFIANRDHRGSTSELDIAARRNNLIYFRWLAHQGVNFKSEKGNSALAEALNGDSLELTMLLLREGAFLRRAAPTGILASMAYSASDCPRAFLDRSESYLSNSPEEFDEARQPEIPHQHGRTAFYQVWRELILTQDKYFLSQAKSHPKLAEFTSILLEHETARDGQKVNDTAIPSSLPSQSPDSDSHIPYQPCATQQPPY